MWDTVEGVLGTIGLAAWTVGGLKGVVLDGIFLCCELSVRVENNLSAVLGCYLLQPKQHGKREEPGAHSCTGGHLALPGAKYFLTFALLSFLLQL